MALLKHDVGIPALKEKCLAQLNDFLKADTKPFVVDLFDFLTNGSTAPPAAATATEPATAPAVKRQAPSEDEEMQELSPNDEDHRHKRQRSVQQDRPKKVCKHFEATGKCSRGASCHFSHEVKAKAGAKFTPAHSSLVGDAKAQRLIVDRIPIECCTGKAVFDCFKRFGLILNIEEDFPNRTATVLFGSHLEAVKAFQCPEPMFENRFVRVQWDSDQAVSEQVLAKAEERKSKKAAKFAQSTMIATALKQRQQLATQRERLILAHIEQQRVIMDRLKEHNINDKDREQLIASLEKISTLIKEATVTGSDAIPSPAIKSHSLDMRSKTLSISSLPSSFTLESLLQKLGSFGAIDLFNQSPNSTAISMQFAERFQAESAFRFLQQLHATDGTPVQVSWVPAAAAAQSVSPSEFM